MKRISGITEQYALKKIFNQALSGTWNGKDLTPYFMESRWYWEEKEITLILTRDTGHHEGGWWKNPDYERCYHLSVSFNDRFGNRKPHNKKKADSLVRLVFGSNSNLVWVEPPYSEEGIRAGVWHYRLFCDANWKAIKPRKEVYSTDFTPPDWKSFSELQKY